MVDHGVRGLDLAYALLEPLACGCAGRCDRTRRRTGHGTSPQAGRHGAPLDEASLDPHAMDPVRVLAMARSLSDVCAEVFILGCEPLDSSDELEGRMELSPEIAAAVPEAVRMVIELVNSLSESAVPAVCAASRARLTRQEEEQ